MVISNNHIIGTDSQGITYALELETGKLKWEKDLNYKRAPGFVSGLVTDGAVVYTGFGKALEAIDAQTGTTIWRNKEWDGGMGSTPTMTIAGDVLIASANWGALYAHDAKTGKLLWKRSDDGLRFRNGNVLYKENSLWVAENFEGKTGALHQLDLKIGKTLNSIALPLQTRATTTPVLTKDKVYVAGSEPGIAAFQRDSGEELWKFDVLPAIFYTPQYYENEEQSIETTPILIGDSLLFGAMDGWIYNLDAKTGKILWKNYLAAPILTSAAVTADGFYICDFAGNIYHFISK
jgi:outer membrane protein assembly factor BamB